MMESIDVKAFMTILVVDDEPKIRDGLSRYLTARKDCRKVLSFRTAEDALTHLEQEDADVLITDIRMPGKSGLDLVSEIRDRHPNLPVIILSGYSEFEFAQKAIELGVRRYLTKPTDLQLLDDLLDEISRELTVDYLPQDQVIRNAVNYMEEHYQEAISLDHLAAAAYVSPNYLCRRFREQMDISPIEYLSQYRIEKACLLLGNPQHTIAEIASSVGYPDSRSFTRVFKRIRGITPQVYRNRMQP